ncbi:MAG: TaqI-like C-terminal specificity domain-containing protein [Bacteroidota bacterium]|nr:restriction endonuclease subunit M [Odoribacter sp.]MDP3644489.1 TaqI-like C-terminal specificity domain-containing protein [Bacteroidota bacterium]
MSLFQKTVERKYLKQLDSKLIAAKYDEFKSYFGNPEIQENIRNSKEEQFQEGFLRELFVKILGYTLNPDPNFNLTTEYKNIKDSKKADGAILTREHAPLSNTPVVAGIIELKGTNTTDLGKIEAQAFSYKNNQPNCVYVVTSNFEKLRFYIDNAIELIEFNLFTLTKPDFDTLFLCLAYDQIAKGIPKKIKEESVSQEDVITKKLYSDYSLFKRELHQNLVSQNPQFDALSLFRKSQKLLDRFLFLFFAEDRQLLPPNSVRMILDDWKDLQERDVEVPLYDRFKKYFGYLNTGFKGKRYDVFAYNGGLFEPDEVLDSVVIDDNLLYKNAIKLSEYDFISEVDVNILGHIFENSLNELDEIQAQLDGKEIDKAKTKRKKDGVFYTPKYITKYIVENTLGKLCSEKKAELQFNEEDYNNREHAPLHRKKTKQTLYEKLKTYQNWLLQLTICDPACGSGAFLNQALDFLIAEHRYIDELQAKLLGVPMILSDVEKSILENNLFGVDLNEESVEIAKLSLWLRTAQPNRKLNDLNNNIKCGNSLISDPAIAGDKAFDWDREFPQVFGREHGIIPTIEARKDATPDYLKLIKEKSLEAQAKAEQAINLSKEAAEISKKVYEYAEKLEEVSELDSMYGNNKNGFDVVIGNPPYVQLSEFSSTSEQMKKFLIDRYKSSMGRLNTFGFFVKLALKLSKANGLNSFIIPNTILTQEYYKKIRFDLLNESEIIEIIQFLELPFSGAVVENIILSFKNKVPNKNSNVKIVNSTIGKFITIKEIPQFDFLNNIDFNFNIYEKEENQSIMQKFEENTMKLGEISEVNQAIALKGSRDLWVHKNKAGSNYVKILEGGKNINRYSLEWGGDYLDYKREAIHSCNRTDIFESSEKIFFRRVANCLIGTLDSSQLYALHTIVVINIKENFKNNFKIKYILSLFNSKAFSFYYKENFSSTKTVFTEIGAQKVRELPIKQVEIENQKPFVEKADLMLSLNKELREASHKFQRSMQRKFDMEDLPGKLQNWYLLSYKEFIAELGKKKVKLSLKEEAEWEDYFLQEAEKALEFKTAIDTTDREIDQMVYQLYGLTDAEIKIVERA